MLAAGLRAQTHIDHHGHGELQERLDDRRVGAGLVRHDPVLGDDVDDAEGADARECLFQEVRGANARAR